MAQSEVDSAMDPDAAPRIIDCLALAHAGLHDVADCCPHCHERPGSCDELNLDVGCGTTPGAIRLTACCRARDGLDYESPELAKLVGEPATP
jgi:hypothetical protein